MSFFGFGQSAELAIVLDNEETKRCARIRTEDGSYEKQFLFYDGETVSGEVGVKLKKVGQKLEHQGIRIDLIGQIEVYYDRGNQHDFICLSKELAKAGELTQNTKFAFCFHNVSKPFESYVGTNVKLRYFLRVTVLRRLTDLTKELDLIVHTLASYPDNDSNIKMEVGIEDCLHIEFEYNRSRYHLKDVIVGKIYFLLVRIKIKYMEIAILKRESVGNGPNLFHENETIAKYEIMDGAPVKGESIPIRLFLAGYDLTPTMRDVGKRFSVKYFLNLVLVDEEDRRYFKQQEITLWRKADKPVRKPLSEQILHPQPITSSAPTNSNEQPTQEATHNNVQSASKEINVENSAEDDERRSIGKNLDEGIVDDDYAGDPPKKPEDTSEQTEIQE
ncbi:vacuolar protein sorting-associated protein 26 domain-containing protein [Ditylenchus destructor]|uniref:Vacuolar protein sorting-associated protein 26 n=1 Tax=Ditylenchus destructor TaxID=166010 RepID=A0AAD4N2U6_9BILA|nr:vacuolar protein sorting-associated protein 26 domain-containing protein [Ditylenchus destructor]